MAGQKLLFFAATMWGCAVCGCRKTPYVTPPVSAAERDLTSCVQRCGLGSVCLDGACPSKLSLATRSLNTCLVREGGSVICWQKSAPDIPIEIRKYTWAEPARSFQGDPLSTCVLKRDGWFGCWGEIWGRAEPLMVPEASLPAKIGIRQFATDRFTCAVLADDTLRCTDSDGTSPMAFSPPIDFGTDPPIGVSTAIVSCALRRSGSVKCFGDGISHNFDRRGADVPLGARRALALAAGERHACAVTEGNRVFCWGANDRGTLGRGHDSWAGPLPLAGGPEEVPLGVTAPIRGISVGDQHNCVWFQDGKLKCWGKNDEGQLGLGDRESRGDGPNEMGDQLPFVDLGTGASVELAVAGSLTTCALLSDQRVKCWGYAYTSTHERGRIPTGDQVPALSLPP